MSIARKSIFLNLFWSVVSFVASTARTIFLAPVFLSNWDNQTYGFWWLIYIFYGMSIYIIEGYSRYNINEYSKLFFVDEDGAYRYFGSVLRFLSLLCAGAILLFFVVLQFSWPAEKLFHVSEIVIDQYQLQYCLLLVFILVCIHSIVKFMAYAILPHGKIYIPERFIAVYVIVESLIWLIAALGYSDLFHLFLLYCCALSAVSIVFLIIIYRKHSFYKKIFSGGSVITGMKGSLRSASIIVNNFCEKFTVDGLNFMVAGLYSAFLVPVYSHIRTMSNLIVTGTNMVVSTFTIEYQKHNVNKDGRSLLNLFNATWLLVGFIVNYGVVVFYPVLPEIFKFWTKGKLELDLTFFNYLLATSVFIAYGSNIITYLKSVNRVKEVLFIAVTRAVILLSLILIFPKELVYIGLSLLIAEFVVNAILLNLILYYEMGRFQTDAVAHKIIWNVMPFCITAAYLLTNEYAPFEPYLKMVITIMLLTVVYFVQIMKVDNEVMVVRLQIIKYKLFGKRRRG
jgi:hypothetical protein